MYKFFKSLDLLCSETQKKKIYLLFFGGFISTLVEMMGLGLIGIYVLALSDTNLFISKIPFEFLKVYFISNNKIHVMINVSIFLILAFVFKSFFSIIFAYYEASVQKSIIVSNSSKLYDIYLKKPYSYFLKQNPQKLVNNINHVLKLGISFIFYNLLLFREIILIFFLVYGSFYLSWKISIIVFITLSVISSVLFFLIKKKLSLLGSQIVSSGQTILKDLNEGLRSIKITKIIKNYNFLNKNYISGLQLRETSQVKHTVFQKIPRAMLETFSVIMLVFITTILIKIFDDPNKVFPILAFLSLILIRLVPSFTNINYALTNLQYTSYAYNILTKDLSIGLSDERDFLNLSSSNNQDYDFDKNLKINLKNISFNYDDSSRQSLNDISIEFNTNSILGFMGKSGSGKTTLVDIIIGLLPPTKGHIEINNKKTILFDSKNWQSNIGYVPQDVILNNSTIKENIAYGVEIEKIDNQKILDIIILTRLDNLIKSLPLGIDTVLKDLGKNLSGGEKQRIGIARALYRNPKILILDEATSSLDDYNEKIILSNLEKLKNRMTIIMITHKYSTIKFCDKVFIFNNGELIDSGLPRNLLNNLENFKFDE